MELTGTLVLVTGASSGIGAAVARAAARAGARVALLARSTDALVSLAAEITAAGGHAAAYPCDLTDPAAVARAAAAIGQDLGVPDLLVNNAGAGRWLAVEETPPEEIVSCMAAPYTAAFLVTRAFLPAMLSRNTGMIVNVTSPAGFLAVPGAAAYSVARWAMRGFTDALRADLHGTGLRAMLFMPGKVSSPYFAHNPGSEERIPGLGAWIPTLTPEQAADALLRGVRRDARQVVVPLMLRIFLTLHQIFPRLVEWLTWRSGWRRRR